MVEGNGCISSGQRPFVRWTPAPSSELAFHGCLLQNGTSKESIGCHYSRLETPGIHASGSDNLVAMVSAIKKTCRLSHSLIFTPAWEHLPHEAKLPHADVISERLDTLMALLRWQSDPEKPTGACHCHHPSQALMQRTFEPDDLQGRARTLKVGDIIDPLDLVEWLEDQAYEPEAKVTQKGEIALRGGILDVFPLSSPWPVRLEFFGDELESIRYFQPESQLTRDRVEKIELTPGGELGIIKQTNREEREKQAPVSLSPFPVSWTISLKMHAFWIQQPLASSRGSRALYGANT